MTSQTESLKPFDEFPIIHKQFDYVEFNLIKTEELLTVVYAFVKTNHETRNIDASCFITTGLVATTYIECAKQIQGILNTGFFTYPISAVGTVYDKDFNQIEDVNWNLIYYELPENARIH